MQPNGDFAVVWDVEDEDGSGMGVYGRRFNRSENRWGRVPRQFRLRMGDQFFPDIAIDPQGNFIVSFWSTDPDHNHNWVAYLRHFSAVVQDGGGRLRRGRRRGRQPRRFPRRGIPSRAAVQRLRRRDHRNQLHDHRQHRARGGSRHDLESDVNEFSLGVIRAIPERRNGRRWNLRCGVERSL